MKASKIFQVSALVLICSLLLVSTESYAAKKADFSGRWTLNEDKSDLGEGRFFAAVKLAITQDGKTITLERTRTGRDGKVLEIKSDSSSARGDRSVSLVYDKE